MYRKNLLRTLFSELVGLKYQHRQVDASVTQLERIVLLYLMTFCNRTVLCLTELVLNLLLLQLLSADDFFFF